MAINTGNFAKAIFPGVNAFFGKEYAEYPVEYTQLFQDFSSRRAYEEDVGVSSFGLARVKDEGASVTNDTEEQAFITRYSHIVYGLGFTVTREIFEDDLYDVVGQRRAQGLAFSMRQTKEINGANVYNRAFNSAYAGGDAKELCATDHPNWAGGTWANEPTTAADLSELSLEQACISISKWTNDRGMKISVMPDCLVIPVDLEFDAYRIMKAPLRTQTADNDVNALASMGKFPGGIKVNHYLTDTNAWFLKTNVKNGMKHWQRRKMEFTIDNDFDTENAKFKATERYSFGWTDPRAIYGSEGA